MSDSDDPIQDIIDNYDKKLGDVGPTSVAIQGGLMVLLAFVTVLFFSILRPHNKLVYAPKWKYSDEKHRPPKISNGYIGWISPVLKTKEDELMDKIGFDGICFLRFHRMCRLIFIGVAVLSCCVLIPVNVVYNLNNVREAQRDFLNILTIQNVDGKYLFVHVAVSYLITIYVCFIIWRNYSKIVSLRWTYCRSEEYMNRLASRSIMVTHVPKQAKSDEGIKSLLNSRNIPYPTTSVHIARRVGELPELVKQHNETVAQLEKILTRHLKNPNKVPTHRPTMSVGGFLGMGSKKVDAIDYLTEKIKRLESRIKTVREGINDRKPENYGFASFAKVPYAHIVGKALQKKRTRGAQIQMAPVPTDIIWENLNLSDGQRGRATFFGWLILAFFLALYIIPMLAISFISNLAAITEYVDFLNTWVTNSKITFAAAVGIVPPVLMLILQLILPMIMRKIARYQGAITKNTMDRYVLARFFAFSVITQFVIFTLIGVAYQVVSRAIVEIGRSDLDKLWDELKQIPQKIQDTYVVQSNYWLTLFALRGFAFIFEIAQVINLTWIWFRTKLFGRTVRDIREWTKPPGFDYPVYYASSLLLVLVGLVYSPLAPIVACFATIAFLASSFVFKYQLMFVYITKHESGGRLWRPVVNRILFSLIAMQVFMVLTIGLKQGWVYCASAGPAIIIVLVFKYILNRKFHDSMTWFIPTEAEIASMRSHMSDEKKSRLERRFGHPCLHQPLYRVMIHKDSEHLLAQVYSGETETSQLRPEGDGKEGGLSLGGLNIQSVAAQDVELSNEAYLREQDLWETGSMASTAVLQGPGTAFGDSVRRGEFAQAYQQYMTHGPSVGMYRSDSRAGDFEMESLSKAGSRESLIKDESGLYSAYHRRNPSQSSLATMSTTQQPFDANAYIQPPSLPYPQQQQQQEQLQQQSAYPYPPHGASPHHVAASSQDIGYSRPSAAHAYSASSGRHTPDWAGGRQTPEWGNGRQTPEMNSAPMYYDQSRTTSPAPNYPAYALDDYYNPTPPPPQQHNTTAYPQTAAYPPARIGSPQQQYQYQPNPRVQQHRQAPSEASSSYSSRNGTYRSNQGGQGGLPPGAGSNNYRYQ